MARGAPQAQHRNMLGREHGPRRAQHAAVRRRRVCTERDDLRIAMHLACVLARDQRPVQIDVYRGRAGCKRQDDAGGHLEDSRHDRVCTGVAHDRRRTRYVPVVLKHGRERARAGALHALSFVRLTRPFAIGHA